MDEKFKSLISYKNKTEKSFPNESDQQNDWYFGAITRTEAENVLYKNGLTNGLFLVRESIYSPGDYVLSCVQNGCALHYQIQRVGDGPFFKINNNSVIHGLDMLLKYFKQFNQTNSSIVLTDHCRCVSPPPDILRHGKSSLLHRTIASADYKIVREILKSEHRPNIDARNNRGQTPLHLAVELDEQIGAQILKELIKAGAYVNSRNSESITPLHLCAKLNKPIFAKILLIEGNADTFVRTIDNGWVALHFAAYFGNVKVVKVLLECGSAPLPRTSTDETPTDLAINANHIQCKKLLGFYSNRPLNQFEPKTKWLFENIYSKYETEILFVRSGMKEGSFLVRKCRTNPNNFVLSMAHNSRNYNFEIQNKNNFYFIDSGPYWTSLEHMIHYHMLNSDGLPSRLSAPLSSFIDISIIEKLIQSNAKNNKRWECSDESGCNENDKCIKSILFIDKTELRIGALIGAGEYGDVFKGVWMRAPNKEKTLVAIKILKNRDVQMRHKNDIFLKEVEVMTSVKHQNIIKLLGVCIGPQLMMVQELAPMGSVLDFLIDHPNQPNIYHDIKLWSIQIAIGMRYLESRHFVHRDLAARNVLLFSLTQIKISDLGLSRALKRNQEFYSASSPGRWPLKWYSPESLRYGTFTHASDVWSYGIVLWEMYSFGEQPYGDIQNLNLIEFFEDGKRLSKPNKCSDSVFALISLCWSLEPKNRPTFEEIVQIMCTNDCTHESMKNAFKS